jgi:phage-related protein
MVQYGLEPGDWKPMRTIGPGVAEIRVHVEGEHRVFYVARFEKAVYVLGAFSKKTQKTPRSAVDLARVRYREVLRMEGLTK